MAQLVKGPRYEYLIEALRGAIVSSMFDLGGEATCERLQIVLDVLRLEPALGGPVQDAREHLEQLLATGDEERVAARHCREAGLAIQTPLGARLEMMTEEERTALSEVLMTLLVECVREDTRGTMARLSARSA